MQSAEFYESANARRIRLMSQAVIVLFLGAVLFMLTSTVLKYERPTPTLVLFGISFLGAFGVLLRSFGEKLKLISFNGDEFGFLANHTKFGAFSRRHIWVEVVSKDIRYFDVPVGFEETAKGQLYVSYVDESGQVRNFIVPTSGLQNSEQERFMETLRKFWPTCRQPWKEQLAYQKRMNCNS